jgi:opacity protein-like surface antigen
LLLLSFLITGNTIQAQQFKPNTEIGILLGASYYLGDLNTVHFNQSSPAAGVVIRKNIDKRFAYKAEIMYLNLRSDERDSDDAIAASRGLHFRSPVYELSGQVEFNFLPYDPGNPLYTWTPFVYVGVSIFNFNPQAENENTNGEWVNLQELGTEGQGTTTFPERKKYSLIQFSAALGGGVKIAVSNSFNIIFEYSTRKTFNDYLDDVSTTYPGRDLTDMTKVATAMSDPLGTHLKGDQRGDPEKNDWYSFAGITLSFKLANKTKGCDY